MTVTLAPHSAAAARTSGRWISHWEPEDDAFWAATGRRIARRNLVWSILVEHFGFSVWLLWSAVAVSLPAAGFRFSVDQLFWLVALPNLVGSVMRLPYTAAVARFGGRNWTTVSSALLLIPIALMVACVTNPATPYWMFLVAAATAGSGRRQLRLVDGEHLLLLSRSGARVSRWASTPPAATSASRSSSSPCRW